jgi:hypothetical protein
VIEGEPLRRSLERGREREHTEIRCPAFRGEHARGATVDEVSHVVGEFEQALPTASSEIIGTETLLEGSR